MELHDWNNLLHKVKNENEEVELSNQEDTASVHFIKRTDSFLFIFNAKPLFSYKSLRHFRNKLLFQIESKSLEINNH